MGENLLINLILSISVLFFSPRYLPPFSDRYDGARKGEEEGGKTKT